MSVPAPDCYQCLWHLAAAVAGLKAGGAEHSTLRRLPAADVHLTAAVQGPWLRWAWSQQQLVVDRAAAAVCCPGDDAAVENCPVAGAVARDWLVVGDCLAAAAGERRTSGVHSSARAVANGLEQMHCRRAHEHVVELPDGAAEYSPERDQRCGDKQCSVGKAVANLCLPLLPMQPCSQPSSPTTRGHIIQ